MAEPARTARPAPLRRDAVLEAVTFAAERLLLAADWHDAIEEVLARFGIAAGVSGPRSSASTRTSARAPSPPVRPNGARPVCRRCPITRGFGARHGCRASSGGSTPCRPASRSSATSRRFPPAEQQEYRAQGIASLAYYPITVEGEWWGCIGFEDCDGPRAWVLSDLDGVRTAAAMLGAAISRQRQEERLRDAETRYRSVVEQIPAVTYVDVSGPEGVRHGVPVAPDRDAPRRTRPTPSSTIPTSGSIWCTPTTSRGSTPRHAAQATRAIPSTRSTGCATPTGTGSGCTTRRRRCTTASGDGHDATSRGSSSTSPRARRPRRRAPQAEHRYRTMVEALPAVTYIDEPIEGEDLNATMPFVSPQIEAILGYPVERFLQDGRFWFSVMHPEDYERLRDAGRPERLERLREHAGIPDAARGRALGVGAGHLPAGLRRRRRAAVLPGVPDGRVDASRGGRAPARRRAALPRAGGADAGRDLHRDDHTRDAPGGRDRLPEPPVRAARRPAVPRPSSATSPTGPP